MTHLEELQHIVLEFACGSRPPDDLRSWLADHVDAVLATDNEQLAALDGLAWTLLSEFGRGDRDEASVRAELGTVAATR